jgi:hypothetical protein
MEPGEKTQGLLQPDGHRMDFPAFMPVELRLIPRGVEAQS